jgi:hypothetical protein
MDFDAAVVEPPSHSSPTVSAGHRPRWNFRRALNTLRIEPVFEVVRLIPNRSSKLEESGTATGAAQLVQR